MGRKDGENGVYISLLQRIIVQVKQDIFAACLRHLKPRRRVPPQHDGGRSARLTRTWGGGVFRRKVKQVLMGSTGILAPSVNTPDPYSWMQGVSCSGRLSPAPPWQPQGCSNLRAAKNLAAGGGYAHHVGSLCLNIILS